MKTAPRERLRNVELFASGVYRGKRYTLAQLDEIVRNGKKLGPSGLDLVDPPTVLGHEENQTLLERHDLPAAAWVNTDSLRVRRYFEPLTGRTEGVLTAHLDNVPPPIAQMIREKRYKRVSAEIYDDFTDDFGNSHGMALRRVALMGGQVPQVKRLKDLPSPTRFSEARPRPARLVPAGWAHTKYGTTVLFSEVEPVDDKAKIMAAMPGLNPATLDAMSPDQLADLAKNLPAAAPAAAPAVAGFAEGDDAPMMDREALTTALAGLGEDPAALDAMTDEDLQSLYTELTAGEGQMAETQMDPAAEPAMTRDDLMAALEEMGEDPAALEAMSDEELQGLFDQLAAAPVAAAPVAQMGERRKTSQAERVAKATLGRVKAMHTSVKTQDANNFAERLVRSGRLLPAHKAIFVRDLIACDDVRVQKFSEPGKKGTYKTQTAYERRKDELRKLPVVARFSERLAAGPAGGRGGASKEMQTVEKFGELGYARGFEGGAAGLVAQFKAMVARKPDATAADLIGASAVALVRG